MASCEYLRPKYAKLYFQTCSHCSAKLLHIVVVSIVHNYKQKAIVNDQLRYYKLNFDGNRNVQLLYNSLIGGISAQFFMYNQQFTSDKLQVYVGVTSLSNQGSLYIHDRSDKNQLLKKMSFLVLNFNIET